MISNKIIILGSSLTREKIILKVLAEEWKLSQKAVARIALRILWKLFQSNKFQQKINVCPSRRLPKNRRIVDWAIQQREENQMPPKAKVKEEITFNDTPEDLNDIESLPFDLDDLDLSDLGNLDIVADEEDLLEAAEQLGEEVSLELSTPAPPSVSDSALMLLQKEVRDMQTMMGKLSNEFDAMRTQMMVEQSNGLNRQYERMVELFKEFEMLLQTKKEQPVEVKQMAQPEGLSEGSKARILNWMRQQKQLPSAQATADGLAPKLNVAPEVIMTFFRENKLVGRGGSLKHP